MTPGGNTDTQTDLVTSSLIELLITAKKCCGLDAGFSGNIDHHNPLKSFATSNSDFLVLSHAANEKIKY